MGDRNLFVQNGLSVVSFDLSFKMAVLLYLVESGILSLMCALCFLLFSFSLHRFFCKGLPEEKIEFSFKLFLAVFFILRTFFEEPGNLPKIRNKNNFFYRESINVTRFKTISLNEKKVYLKFCKTCGIWRAPRSSHCSPCKHCIMESDHHCPWIGACIGLRNYRSFLIFISALFFYFVALLRDVSIRFFQKEKKFYYHGISWNIIGIIIGHAYLISWCIIFLTTGILFTGALFCFHFYLGLYGKTTSELFKFPKKKMSYRDSKQEIFSRLCKENSPSLTKINRFFSKPAFLLNRFKL